MILTFKKYSGIHLYPLLLFIFGFTACTKDNDSVVASLKYTLNGSGTGSQVVPASNNRNGAGTFSGTYNAGNKVMNYTSTWTNLTGTPLSGGIYSGAAGQVGTNMTLWSLTSGLSMSGSYSGTATLSGEQESQLLTGKTYYVVGTAANVLGEIRGQISASAQ